MTFINKISTHNKNLDILYIFGAIILCCIVYFINRSPLFYVDTAAYIAQGDAVLQSVGGLIERLLPAAESANADQGEPSDAVVVGSRSATYAVFLSLANSVLGVGAAAVGQAALFVFSVWLTLSVIDRGTSDYQRYQSRVSGGRFPACRVTALAVMAGCLGSLPFYTAYLMPDIFTPILILIVATLAMFGSIMRGWEMVLAVLTGAVAVTAHPSNLLIGGLLLGGAAIVALAARTRRPWIGLVLITAILALGLAERTLFTATAKTVRQAEVIYLPFLTVRVIVDGPGFSYLAEKCPTPELSTCTLYEKLKDAPERVHASKMLFSRSPEEGSFALLDTETQKRIAQEQGAFFANVVKSYPVSMALAVLNNAITQVGYVSVIMSFPTDNTLANMGKITSNLPTVFSQARFSKIPDWLPVLDRFHRWVYWASGLITAALLLWPWGGPPMRVRCFVVIVFGGIAANALVCGGISQPAERYGARVIFLVPMMAVFLFAFRTNLTGSSARQQGQPVPQAKDIDAGKSGITGTV